MIFVPRQTLEEFVHVIRGTLWILMALLVEVRQFMSFLFAILPSTVSFLNACK